MDRREPTLEELLNEPIIQAIMARDSVRADEIRRLMRQVHARPTNSGYLDRCKLTLEIEHAHVPLHF
jgi:hypothetical protein